MDSSGKHQRLTDIYLEACDLQGEERMAYLDQACGDDLSLREEVEAMLATHSNSGDDLDGLLEGEPTLLRDLLTDINKAKLPQPHRRLPGGQGTWPRGLWHCLFGHPRFWRRTRTSGFEKSCTKATTHQRCSIDSSGKIEFWFRCLTPTSRERLDGGPPKMADHFS